MFTPILRRAVPSRMLLQRQYSARSTFSAKDLKITPTSNPKPLVPNNELVFGHTFTDHMLSVEWAAGKGWAAPEIKAYQNLSLQPSAVVFHYAFECFEGMKAYKDKEGRVRLFRPDMNMKRMNFSAERIALPTFDGEELTNCIKRLVKQDARWVPDQKGYSLYIRPTLIGTQETLGVAPSDKALLFVICCPVGPYYKTGFNAVSLRATSEYVRAWPGGTGYAKIGGNYAPGIKPQREATAQGFQQNLWVFGPDQQICEVGTMNLFAFWENEQGETELVTPELDGTILPGVTRDSILQLARGWGEFKVTERRLTMPEVVRAVQEKRMKEMFGAGTACIVSPIKHIQYDDLELSIPLDPSNPQSQAGPLTKRINDTILAIQHGEIPHEWSVVVD
ncbi:uncharacterized protein VTP21DRAFT_5029 [Calcarisporiella thermophila]|uniref:uncharacterized protein n=1 Tax=Calcarisporiella thermophila TaxID=911321 RepID=UPI0037422453